MVPNYELGHDVLVLADFSAQEVLAAAIIANDETLLQAFKDGKDMHTVVASMAFGLPEDEIPKDLRKQAKAVTFGILYGKNTDMLYKDLEVRNEDMSTRPMTEAEGQDLVRKYFSAFPSFKRIIEEAHEELRQDGYVEVPSGFQRKLGAINSSNFADQQGALRQALNTKVQGVSAYLTQLALINVNRAFKKLNIDANITVTVHDSIVVSTKRELLPKVIHIMERMMTELNTPFLDVTLNGKKEHFKLALEIDISEQYNDERPYVEDEVVNAKSTAGYFEYYDLVQKLNDKHSYKLITDEEYEAEFAELESQKQYYMNK